MEKLPLQGITLDKGGSLNSSLEIMLGGGGAVDMRHSRHTVPQVRRIVAKFGSDAREDALEIESERSSDHTCFRKSSRTAGESLIARRKYINSTNVFLSPRSISFGRDTSPLVKQSREMTLILKTYT